MIGWSWETSGQFLAWGCVGKRCGTAQMSWLLRVNTRGGEKSRQSARRNFHGRGNIPTRRANSFLFAEHNLRQESARRNIHRVNIYRGNIPSRRTISARSPNCFSVRSMMAQTLWEMQHIFSNCNATHYEDTKVSSILRIRCRFQMERNVFVRTIARSCVI